MFRLVFDLRVYFHSCISIFFPNELLVILMAVLHARLLLLLVLQVSSFLLVLLFVFYVFRFLVPR